MSAGPIPADPASPETWDVAVIGAGAAGFLAATRAAERGLRTVLLEKNRKPGVKILISGGTRCNLTHATDRRGIADAFGRPGRFLHSALAALGPDELIDLFAAEGVPTKVEATGKVFPVSDTAVDVQQALLRRLAHSGATLRTGAAVLDLIRDGDLFRIALAGEALLARQVVLTTGGQSYAGCGTTGDGYGWAAAFGHRLVSPRPALVPVTLTAEWVPPLKGLTLPDVGVRLRGGAAGKVLVETRGSFLFTHWGASGPAVLDISREITAQTWGQPGAGQELGLTLEVDLLPDVGTTELDERLRAEIQSRGGAFLATVLAERLPRRLAEAVPPVLLGQPDRQMSQLSRETRQALVRGLKALPLPVSGTLGFEKAEVTAGGVDLGDVDSRTMASRQVPGLYLAGEILDLDGPIGGYNFQAAFSTGWLAGESVGG